MKKVLWFIVLIVVLCAVYATASTDIFIKVITEDTNKERVMSQVKESLFFIPFRFGNLYFNEGDLEKAAALFEKSIELKSDFELAHHNLGTVYYEQGNIEEAIAEFGKAIEFNDGYTKAHYSLGLAYREIADYDNAIYELEKVTEQEPDNAAAFFDLAITYSDRFRFAEGDISDLYEALEYYKRVEEIRPDFPHASQNRQIIENILSLVE